MDLPKITVLMAVYNGEEFLKLSLSSILNQTLSDFEFLIVNDCSTDKTVEIVESFDDERIKIHHNESNLGQTKSLNVGLERASGDFIARIDADDFAMPNWLAEQIEFIEKNPRYSAVSTYVFAIDENNEVRKLYKPPVHREDLILRALITSPINHVGSILRKEDIIKIGGYDENLITAADFGLWGKLLREGLNITTNPKVLMAIREHAQSLSRSRRGRSEIGEIMEVVEQNIKKFTKTDLSGDELRLFCDVNFNEGVLEDAEFDEAIHITENVYLNLIPSVTSDKSKKLEWTKGRLKILYLKRVFSLIDRKDYSSIMRLIKNAMKKLGYFNIFLMLWAASLLRGVVLRFVPGLYERLLRQRALAQLGHQSRIEGLTK